MGRNLHWSIILASEDQHPAGCHLGWSVQSDAAARLLEG